MMVSRGGRSLSEASWVISTVGISNTVGRVLFGWAVDRTGVSSLLVTNASLAASAACLAALVLCRSFAEYLGKGFEVQFKIEIHFFPVSIQLSASSWAFPSPPSYL